MHVEVFKQGLPKTTPYLAYFHLTQCVTSWGTSTKSSLFLVKLIRNLKMILLRLIVFILWSPDSQVLKPNMSNFIVSAANSAKSLASFNFLVNKIRHNMCRKRHLLSLSHLRSFADVYLKAQLLHLSTTQVFGYLHTNHFFITQAILNHFRAFCRQQLSSNSSPRQHLLTKATWHGWKLLKKLVSEPRVNINNSLLTVVQYRFVYLKSSWTLTENTGGLPHPTSPQWCGRVLHAVSVHSDITPQ